jgi:hypothetical protein
MAAVLTDKLLFSLALNSARGVMGTAWRRGESGFVKSGLLQPTSGISRLMWGAGILNHHIAGTVSLACAAGYELPPIIAAIAGDTPEGLWSLQRYAPPGQPEANIATYKTPAYILSSAQDYLAGQPGRQEQIWQVTFGAQAVVFTNHPGSSSEADQRFPGYWSGNARLPRVAQWRDVLAAVHHLSESDRFCFTHAYFPAAAFDEYTLREGWAFARSGEAYLALTNSQGFSMVSEGPYAWRELRAQGGEQIWLLHMGTREVDGAFVAFQEQILGLPVSFEGNTVRCKTLRGDTLSFGWEGAFTVNDAALPSDGFRHVENMYTTADLPCHEMEIHYGGQGLRLDFTLPDSA